MSDLVIVAIIIVIGAIIGIWVGSSSLTTKEESKEVDPELLREKSKLMYEFMSKKEMVGPLFIVNEKLDPSSGEKWSEYLKFTDNYDLDEVVTLDSTLCPPALKKLKDEYWPHIFNEDFMLDYFKDLNFLLDEIDTLEGRNLLCVFRNPQEKPEPPPSIYNFRFIGYDLVDIHGGVSALTNCGSLPRAFSEDDLSRQGLILSLERAQQVQINLIQEYPDNPHAYCHVWAIFRSFKTPNVSF